ncbi:MAG TPA: M28 family peptidase, partial [Herpetosiphonaceae bacterium]
LQRWVPAVRNFARSDHLAFWEAGLPALMVTDTANFRYWHYHQPSDTPEKLDYQRLAAIVGATAAVLADVAGLIRD